MSLVYLLLWWGCSNGPADHIILLPSEADCRALAQTLRVTESLTSECQTWATTAPADATCEFGYP